jgi:hypothetical protein
VVRIWIPAYAPVVVEDEPGVARGVNDTRQGPNPEAVVDDRLRAHPVRISHADDDAARALQRPTEL